MSGTVGDLKFYGEDPFAENDNNDIGHYIHIRIQQRNGRKTLTTVQGIPKELDLKKLLRALKKEFACNGTLVDNVEMGQVIQLQGDQRMNALKFLTTECGVDKKAVKIHGF
ncbi:hypothetical protein CANCADRAFT_86486 [Tortispora caseinolytica NRRL Y-17796]|uniref:SUI1 domain-containing protein n=1 Tax=Tortispora caseinolytica NRRL Y-17796 TaxID=767744 RepID=A0A1E4TKX4_9ASCO|nr:hypothetical protein CANCADRAFT_86486 [Tortispora caseinolytica NRRL Y-17796]